MPKTKKTDSDRLDGSHFRSKGTYALLLWVREPARIPIRLGGGFLANRGWYSYIGSAFGSGGLAARLSRHVTTSHRPHWHIDYFKAAAEVREIWYTYDSDKRESLWTSIFEDMPGSGLPCPGFGASDCKGETHLFRFDARPSTSAFCKRLWLMAPDHGRVFRVTLARAES